MTPSYKTYITYGLAVILALAASFAAGRYTVPSRVEVHTEYVDRIREVRTTLVQRVVDTKVRRVIVVEKDGSSKTEETIDTHEDTRSAENEKVERDTEAATRTIKVSDTKNWTLFVIGGASVPMPWNPTTNTSLTFGFMLNRRLFGPVWANSFALSNGTVGGGVGLEF
jgi:hypothetical protein